jgi:penicillin-binding protein A
MSSTVKANMRKLFQRRAFLVGLAFGVMVLAAIVVVVTLALTNDDPAKKRDIARQFETAWQQGNYQRMYALLDPKTQHDVSLDAFAASYHAASRAATATGVTEAGPLRVQGDLVSVPITVHTRVFGDIGGAIALPLTDTDAGWRVAWQPDVRFPGLRGQQELAQHLDPAPRAPILAADGKQLSAGPNSQSALGEAGLEIAGRVGPSSQAQKDVGKYEAGTSGLERAYDDQLSGVPGGVLMAGPTVLAHAAPRPGRPLLTTIDTNAQQAAVTALANRPGGIAIIRPSDGAVLGLSGFAISTTQPPGSTFKMITTAAALESNAASPQTTFPMQNSATLSGVKLNNNDNEVCGGTLDNAFAVSCNSVFAPLGARIGASKLVDTAKSFGFNVKPRLVDAKTSTIPEAPQLRDDLAVGSSAIGQGSVSATPLEMASVAGAIANGGMQASPMLARDLPVQQSKATTAPVAAQLKQFMQDVVTHGTGTAAAIPGMSVAGKTGTAELRASASNSSAPPDPRNSDAWFAGFAPADHPQIAVSILLIGAGQGGQSAAPLARQVLQSTVGH